MAVRFEFPMALIHFHWFNNKLMQAEHIIFLMGESLNKVKLLSVIVPIGGFPNGSHQIRAWLNQKISREVEVIIVNDSADLSTTQEIERIVEGASSVEINVVTSTARNPGGARNVGLSHATGEWVCFWDSDDVGMIDVALNAINAAEHQSADLIIGKFRWISVNKEIEITQEVVSKNLTIDSVYVNPGLWRFIIKRNQAKTVKFPELRMGEDQVFAFKILQRTRNILFIDSIIYDYYNYPGLQLTKTKSSMDDLFVSFKLTLGLCRRERNYFLLIAVLRQSISVIRYCRVKYKVQALLQLMELLLRAPRFLKDIPTALLGIARFK
jgi:glycosyltransferase involved in cell wall biosynthesis